MYLLVDQTYINTFVLFPYVLTLQIMQQTSWPNISISWFLCASGDCDTANQRCDTLNQFGSR